MLDKKNNSTLGSYDAENFYDCVEHNFASLTDQDFNIPLPEIICCLKAIQEMKFYLRMSFGDPKGSYYGTMLQPFQGLHQSKGGTPTGWFTISYIIIIYLREK